MYLRHASKDGQDLGQKWSRRQLKGERVGTFRVYLEKSKSPSLVRGAFGEKARDRSRARLGSVRPRVGQGWAVLVAQGRGDEHATVQEEGLACYCRCVCTHGSQHWPHRGVNWELKTAAWTTGPGCWFHWSAAWPQVSGFVRRSGDQ